MGDVELAHRSGRRSHPSFDIRISTFVLRHSSFPPTALPDHDSEAIMTIMGRFKRRVYSAIFTTVLAAGFAFPPHRAEACPNCKVNVEDTTNAAQADGDPADTSPRANMAAGYYYSILFMMPLPFIMVTALLIAIRKQARRDARAHGDLYR